MNKIIKAVFSALVYFVLLILLPLLALNFIPTEWQQYINSMSQVSFPEFMQSVIIIGIILIILSTIKSFTEKNDIKHLLASIAMILVGLYLTLFFFGLGNALSFGVTKQTMSMQGTNITIENNFSFIIALFIFVALLKIAKELTEFYFAIKSASRQ